MIETYLKEKKSIISSFISTFLERKKKTPDLYWNTDVLTRLITYTTTGKMLRGSLVFLGYEVFSGIFCPDLTPLASAMELFQTGLLIHDDIMDHAGTRRGIPSMHMQYKEMISSQSKNQPTDAGGSMAICVGDAAFFFGYELLSTLNNVAHCQSVLQRISRELSSVSIAQMQDISLGISPISGITQKDILTLYRQKTGQYSVTLPLTIGASLAGASEQSIKQLELFGSNLGIAFQLTDDLLDILGTNTGKPLGTDIREGKKTVLLLTMLQKADEKTKNRLEGLVGNSNISDDDIAFIRSYIIQNKIDSDMKKMTEEYKTAALNALNSMKLPKQKKELIVAFAQYLVNRIQ